VPDRRGLCDIVDRTTPDGLGARLPQPVAAGVYDADRELQGNRSGLFPERGPCCHCW
jgi:hypothetical protein